MLGSRFRGARAAAGVDNSWMGGCRARFGLERWPGCDEIVNERRETTFAILSARNKVFSPRGACGSGPGRRPLLAQRGILSAAGGGLWRDYFQKLVFAVDQGVDVVGGELEAVAVGDGVGGAGLDAVAAKDAAGVIDVVDAGVALAGGDALGVGIFGGFDIDAAGGAGGGAEEAADAFLEAVFIALQDVNAAIARLKMDGLVGIDSRWSALRHILRKVTLKPFASVTKVPPMSLDD